MPTINFMLNSVVELYSLDMSASYQHAFVYIRQLAIHLRNSLQVKTKDSHKAVYNWQFVNCLKLWAQLISQYGNTPSSELYLLVYPLVQICIGVTQLQPSSRFFPLRFAIVRVLNQIAEHTGVYVPVAALLLDVFSASEFKKKPTNSKSKTPDLRYLLKVSPAVSGTRGFQQAVVSYTLKLLLEHFAIYSYSIGYPELIMSARVFLKKFSKSTHIQQIKKQVTTLLDKLERNSQWIIARRNKVDYSPKDMRSRKISEVDTFRSEDAVSPLAKYAELMRKEEEEAAANDSSDWRKMLTQGTGFPSKGEEQEEEEEDSDVEEESEEEEEEEKPAPKKKKGKKESKKMDVEESASDDDGEEIDLDAVRDDGDKVEDFEFSDSD